MLSKYSPPKRSASGLRLKFLPDRLEVFPRAPHLVPSFVKIALGRICLPEFPEASELFQVLAADEKICTMLQPARGQRFSHDAVRELESFFSAPPLTAVFDLRTIFLEDLIVCIEDRRGQIIAVLMLSLVHSFEPASPRLGMRIDYVGSLPGHSQFNFLQVLCNAAEQFAAFRIMLDDRDDRLAENYKLVPDLTVYLVLPVKRGSNPSAHAGFVLNEQGQDHWGLPADELALERALDLRIGERLVHLIDGALAA